MPNVPEYFSARAARGLEPSETGAEALNRAAPRIEEGYQQEGRAIGSGLSDLGRMLQYVTTSTGGGGRGPKPSQEGILNSVTDDDEGSVAQPNGVPALAALSQKLSSMSGVTTSVPNAVNAGAADASSGGTLFGDSGTSEEEGGG